MTKQPQYISFNSIINRMILNEWMNEFEWMTIIHIQMQ